MTRRWTDIDVAVPVGRDRVVDGLRALAMVGVVAGHWLVTGLVETSSGHLQPASPLTVMPALASATWLFQTLGVFFFAAGYASARASASAARRGTPAPTWWAGRVGKLLRPVAMLLLVWLTALLTMAASGTPSTAAWKATRLLVSPLWFLVVLVVLALLTPAVAAACRVAGLAAVLAPIGVLVVVDAIRYGPWPVEIGHLGLVSVLAAWLFPYALGVAMATGRLSRRPTGWRLLAGGAVAAVVLVGVAGYPVSLVGVPGDGRSNLDPPSLLIAAATAVQLGVALLCWSRLAALLRRPKLWAVVVVVNVSAMTVFLWHQPALLAVAALARAASVPLDGLIGPPDRPAWILLRLCWFPAFALVLALVCVAARRRQRTRATPADPRPPHPRVPAQPLRDMAAFWLPHRDTAELPRSGSAELPVKAAGRACSAESSLGRRSRS